MKQKGEIKIYRSKKGEIEIKTHLKDESIWLTLNQIANLFNTDKSGVSRHIKNIYSTGELTQEATVVKNATVQKEGIRAVKRNIEYYNLDIILSIGYKVNSKKATDFRIWATKTLKNYLVKGYAINDQKIKEVKSIIQFITAKAKNKELTGHEKEILDVIEKYAKSWKILSQYDENKIQIRKFNKV